MPTLYIFSGLPGAGKTTLAERLAKQVSAVYLRIDTVEQALRDLCAFEVEGEGYRLSIDTAGRSVAECFEELTVALQRTEMGRG